MATSENDEAAAAAAASAQNGDSQKPATVDAPRFKASELPLSSATRDAIQSLARSFKKEGAYDEIRKQVWEKFKASVSPCLFIRALDGSC